MEVLSYIAYTHLGRFVDEFARLIAYEHMAYTLWFFYRYPTGSRQHYLCISAPAMALEKPPPTPGPGAYDTVDYEGAPKHFMSGSSFVSVTTRCTGAPIALVPGPGTYRSPLFGSFYFFIL